MSRTIGLLMLIVLPPALILYAAVTYGFALPFGDQWEMSRFFIEAANGRMSLAGMWAQQNEHRIVIPKAVWGALAWLTEWNILYELIANVVVAGLIFGALVLILRRTVGRNDRLPLAAVASLLVFSPIQATNWSSISASRFSVLGAVLAILCVARWPGQWGGLAAAMGGAILASYSFNSGLLSLVAVGGFLLLQRPLRRSFIVSWVVVSAVVVYFYYHGYRSQVYDYQVLLGFATHPVSFIGYVLAYLGLPLGFQNLAASIVAGGLLAALLGWGTIGVLRAGRGEFDKALPWLILASYVLLSAAATGAGRMLRFGVGQALSTRYATTSTLFTVAVVVVVVQAARLRRVASGDSPGSWTVGFRMLCGAFGLAYVLSFASGWRILVSQKRELSGSHLVKYIGFLPLDYERFRRRAALFTSERISIFAFDDEECTTARRTVYGGMGRIDLVNGVPFQREAEPVLIDRSRNDMVVVVGWAADGENEKPADEVLVVIDGKPAARAFYGLRRPDVSRVYESDALLLTGWEAFVDVRGLEEGVHRLSMQVLSEGGDLCYQPEQRYLMDVRKGKEEQPAEGESDRAENKQQQKSYLRE